MIFGTVFSSIFGCFLTPSGGQKPWKTIVLSLKIKVSRKSEKGGSGVDFGTIFHYFCTSFRWFLEPGASSKTVSKKLLKNIEKLPPIGWVFWRITNPFFTKNRPWTPTSLPSAPRPSKITKKPPKSNPISQKTSIKDAHRSSELLKTGDCRDPSIDQPTHQPTGPPTIQASNQQTYWRQTGPAGCAERLNNQSRQ